MQLAPDGHRLAYDANGRLTALLVYEPIGTPHLDPRSVREIGAIDYLLTRDRVPDAECTRTVRSVGVGPDGALTDIGVFPARRERGCIWAFDGSSEPLLHLGPGVLPEHERAFRAGAWQRLRDETLRAHRRVRASGEFRWLASGDARARTSMRCIWDDARHTDREPRCAPVAEPPELSPDAQRGEAVGFSGPNAASIDDDGTIAFAQVRCNEPPGLRCVLRAYVGRDTHFLGGSVSPIAQVQSGHSGWSGTRVVTAIDRGTAIIAFEDGSRALRGEERGGRRDIFGEWLPSGPLRAARWDATRSRWVALGDVTRVPAGARFVEVIALAARPPTLVWRSVGLEGATAIHVSRYDGTAWSEIAPPLAARRDDVRDAAWLGGDPAITRHRSEGDGGLEIARLREGTWQATPIAREWSAPAD